MIERINGTKMNIGAMTEAKQDQLLDNAFARLERAQADVDRIMAHVALRYANLEPADFSDEVPVEDLK